MRRIAVVLWYSRQHRGIMTRIAHYFAWRILTSVKEGCASSDPKIIVTGQMVDTKISAPAVGALKAAPPLFISVGRLTPIKDLMTFVRAAALVRDAGYDMQYACIGPVLSYDADYYASLKEEVHRLSLEDRFVFTGPVAYQSMPAEYHRVCIHVNLCPTGSFDKCVLEAMACGTPSVATNAAHRNLFGKYAEWLLFRYRDAESLAAVLIHLLAESPTALYAMYADLRDMVVRIGSMDSFFRQFRKIVAPAPTRAV